MITTIKFFQLFKDSVNKNSISINNKYIYYLTGILCKNEKDLFEHLKDKLEFPDYFGWNWNALIDCLSDFSWVLTNKLTIFISDINLFLIDEANLNKKNYFYKILFSIIVNRYKETIFEDPDEYVTLNLVFITNSENEKLIDSLFKEYNVIQSEIDELL